MSRTALSCVERAKREVLPLDLALYHAVREYPGGAAAIAATSGRNATTLQHKLSPTHPSHVVNIQEFGEILELTKDSRILDAVHALVGDTIWQELSGAYTEDMPETLTMGTLANIAGYGAGNPRDFVSGRFTSLVNCGERVNSLGELDI